MRRPHRMRGADAGFASGVAAPGWILRFASKTLLLVGVPVMLAGCGEPPTQVECERMLDRYTELLVRSDRPGAKAAEREKLKAEARSKASRDPEFGRCGQRVSRRQLDCALEASDVDAMERCLL